MSFARAFFVSSFFLKSDDLLFYFRKRSSLAIKLISPCSPPCSACLVVYWHPTGGIDVAGMFLGEVQTAHTSLQNGSRHFELPIMTNAIEDPGCFMFFWFMIFWSFICECICVCVLSVCERVFCELNSIMFFYSAAVCYWFALRELTWSYTSITIVSCKSSRSASFPCNLNRRTRHGAALRQYCTH